MRRLADDSACTLLDEGARQLRRRRIPAARREAELLLSSVLGRDRSWFVAHPEGTVAPHAQRLWRELIERRAAREPLAYLVGEKEFFGLRLRVDRRVLVPRPETELLAEATLAWLSELGARERSERVRLLEVGTGSGAVAIALTTKLPWLEVIATDLGRDALLVARENAHRYAVMDRIRWVCGDLVKPFSGKPGLFRAIVANLPYVSRNHYRRLSPEVRNFEPRVALCGGPSGLDLLKRLISESGAILGDGGLLALEIGKGQKAAVARLLGKTGQFGRIRFLEDLARIPRVVLAIRRSKRG